MLDISKLLEKIDSDCLDMCNHYERLIDKEQEKFQLIKDNLINDKPRILKLLDTKSTIYGYSVKKLTVKFKNESSWLGLIITGYYYDSNLDIPENLRVGKVGTWDLNGKALFTSATNYYDLKID